MAFTIEELREVEADIVHVRVRHGTEIFEAIIPEPKLRIESLGSGFTAELDFCRVVRHETGLMKDDAVSGIFATDDPTVVVVDGSVSNLLEIGSGHFLIDVYVRNGPEFVCVDSEDVGGTIPELESRVRLWLEGLKIYPTFN